MPRTDRQFPNIETWRMTRVTFETSPSTFFLAATMQHHLATVEEELPMTVTGIRNSLNVDGIMLGSDSVEEAMKTFREARQIFRRSAMISRKWASKSEERR